MQKKIFVIFLLTTVYICGQQNWKWQNPYPQGKVINEISIIDSINVYAAGETGLLLKSTDGGNNWKIIETGYQNNLHTLFFTDEVNGWIAGGEGIILRTTDGGLSFSRQDTGGVTFNINSIFFTSAETGFAACSNGVLLSTTNGGSLWTATINNPQLSFSKVYFLNHDTGWLTGANGIIKKTTDGGTTWIDEKSGVNYILSSICFTDQDYGWICGQSGQIIKTTDGGNNWSILNSSTNKWLLSISFVDRNTGITTGKNGVILRTSDGGNSWNKEVHDSTYTFNCVSFLRTGTGLLAGSSGFLARSIDAGINWEFLSSGNHANLNAIYFRNRDYGFIVGDQGTILETSDGGNTWIKKESNTTTNLNDIVFCSDWDNSQYWIAGDKGLLKSTDYGETWTFIFIRGVTTDNFKAIVYNLYTCYAAGDNGTILGIRIRIKTVLGKPVNNIGAIFSDNFTHFEDIIFLDPRHIIATGENGLLATAWLHGLPPSYDFSKSFIPNVGKMNQICFVGKKAWMTGLYGVVLKSTSNGTTWKKSFADITEGNGIQFIDTSNGYICGSNGTFLKSNDGGSTWNNILTHTTNRLSKMYFRDIDTGWVIGANGLIMKTDNGGGAPAASGINDDIRIIPKTFSVSQNFPNPFNPETKINYSISEKCHVTIKVFNILGKEITTLINADSGPGNYNIKFGGSGLPSGIYFYRIQAGDFSETRKMILLK